MPDLLSTHPSTILACLLGTSRLAFGAGWGAVGVSLQAVRVREEEKAARVKGEKRDQEEEKEGELAVRGGGGK